MAKVPVSVIERIAVPIRDRSLYVISEKDVNGRSRRRPYDGYIGIGRRVVAATAQGAIVFDESRFSSRFRPEAIESIRLDSGHHRGLNRWMEQTTVRINRRQGNNKATIQGDFISGTQLASENVPIFNLGYMHAESFFFLKHVADQLSIGEHAFSIMIDTDAEPKRPEMVKIMATSPQAIRGRWDDFVDCCNVVSDAFYAEREKGIDIDMAQYAADIALREALELQSQAS